MIDKAHIQTDKELLKLEKRLKSFYDARGREIASKAGRYFSGYYSSLSEMETLLEDGEITQDQFDEWAFSQSISQEARKGASKLARDVVDVDVEAMGIITGTLATVWVINRIQMQNETVEAAKKFGVSMEYVYHNSPEEIRKEFERLKNKRDANWRSFTAEIDQVKDLAWTDKHFQAAIQNGMRQGYGTKKMEKYIKQAMIPNYHSCVRYARTYITAVENGARLEDMKRLIEEGWIVSKEWIATHDHRVRDSHKNQNHYELDDPYDRFPNGLLFPGDRSTNDPGEFINCRCRMNIKRLEAPNEWIRSPE